MCSFLRPVVHVTSTRSNPDPTRTWKLEFSFRKCVPTYGRKCLNLKLPGIRFYHIFHDLKCDDIDALPVSIIPFLLFHLLQIRTHVYEHVRWLAKEICVHTLIRWRSISPWNLTKYSLTPFNATFVKDVKYSAYYFASVNSNFLY
jgi:hypothetical protein